MVHVQCRQAHRPLYKLEEREAPNPNRRIPTATKSLGCSWHAHCNACPSLSDLCLQCCNGEGLHHGLSWLHPSLDPAKARDSEDAVLLHLCCGKGRQATKKSRHCLGLQLMLFGELLDKASFGHGLACLR